MMLYEHFYTSCVEISPSRTEDGAGGYVTSWTEGTDEFECAIVLNTSAEAVSAEKQGLTKSYNVVTEQSLKYHDVIKRVDDGKVFRITSDATDGKTPSCASFRFFACTAEEWRLPS